MKVIRNGTGWDIALDIIFKDKDTATILARRIEHAVYALIRAGVDERMGERARKGLPGEADSKTLHSVN